MPERNEGSQLMVLGSAPFFKAARHSFVILLTREDQMSQETRSELSMKRRHVMP